MISETKHEVNSLCSKRQLEPIEAREAVEPVYAKIFNCRVFMDFLGMTVFMFVCLSVGRYICMYVCLFVCLSVHCLFTWLPAMDFTSINIAMLEIEPLIEDILATHSHY